MANRFLRLHAQRDASAASLLRAYEKEQRATKNWNLYLYSLSQQHTALHKYYPKGALP
ncbi:hypothetical protein PILCRDRAFT_813583 [Piloderma croceum F 1598]|uniref:Uncharacterized protein n=1 Tax=Piloderma croceum (strain F 1598) TaxID=765440 RepID=A0A0C3FWW7_PILCF|nr:hypothetical protein PILCRDRAFT_813583 [Piloderma croceum F 1598]